MPTDPATLQDLVRHGFANKRVTIMGLGTFGGGLAAAQFFLRRGARLTITDLRSATELATPLAQLDQTQLTNLVLGEHRESDFANADVVVINPAVQPQGNHFLQIAKRHHALLTSEIELFWHLCSATKIVVTGTVGKSTTTTLIQHVLDACGQHTYLGGNLGISLLPQVEMIPPDATVVLELSSFQLAALERIQIAPDISVVTNFHPNHLDWHHTIQHYAYSKQTALRQQTEQQYTVLNADCAVSSNWSTAASTIWFGKQPRGKRYVQIKTDRFSIVENGQEHSLSVSDLPACLRFAHHHENVAAALAVVCLIRGLSIDQIRPAVASYPGLPHRLELLPQQDGRIIINDSKATTPEATLAALHALSGPVVLIAGGKDKGVDLSLLCQQISARTKAVALIGETALSMEKTILLSNPEFKTRCCENFAEAIAWAFSQTDKGETLLLSPGCASHSEFLNFEDRGNKLRDFFQGASPQS